MLSGVIISHPKTEKITRKTHRNIYIKIVESCHMVSSVTISLPDMNKRVTRYSSVSIYSIETSKAVISRSWSKNCSKPEARL